MPDRSETSYIVHNIVPMFEALGYPGAGDHERVKINDVPVLRPSGGRSSSTMDIVYYHGGEPLLIVEAKSVHKAHRSALREAQDYRKNFPVRKKEFAPSGKAPVFIATTVGKDIQFYKDIFIVENNQLKQRAKPIKPLKFDELLEFYGLVPDFLPRKLTGETFGQEFLSELIRLYNTSRMERVSPRLIEKISKHLINYLSDDKKFKHKRPYIDLDDHPLRQKGIIDLHRRYDLLGSLGPDIGNEFRRFILRAFQGTPFNQYLTPQSVISFMINIAGPLKKKSRVIDFECGSGGYLAAAIEKGGLSLTDVLGIDIDMKPLVFARTFLSLFFGLKGKDINKIKLLKRNGLTYDIGNWDYVIGNPAGSAKYTYKDINKVLCHLCKDLEGGRKNDGFTEYNLAIQQAIWLARPGGIICLLVPEGLLSNSNDQFLRLFISRNCKIMAIVSLPRGSFRKGKTSRALSSGGQTATMKMNVFLAQKLHNLNKTVDDYPIFLAQIYDPENSPADVDSWLGPRLELVYQQWLNWNNKSKLELLDEELMNRAALSETKTGLRKQTIKDPNQQELL